MSKILDLELGDFDKGEISPLIESLKDEGFLTKDLIEAYKTNDRVKFFDTLSKFPNVEILHGKNCMETLLYETLLKSPRDDAFFDNYKEVFILNIDNYSVILNTLLTSNFYCNFQKVVHLNCSDGVSLIDEYICSLLDVFTTDEITIQAIRIIRELDITENILKYLLDFKKIRFEPKISNIAPIFMRLVISILANEAPEKFKQQFDEFVKQKSEEFGGNLDYLEVDFNVLLRTMFLNQYKPGIETMLDCSLVNVNNLKIHMGLYRSFAEIVAQRGYYTLLKKLLLRNFKSLDNIFNETLYGCTFEIPIDENFYPSDHKLCLQILIKSPGFEDVMLLKNPMWQAVKHRNDFAVFELIDTFGFRPKFVDDLSKDLLEAYLDKCVREISDSEEKSRICVDFNFLSHCGISNLKALTKNKEMEELVTHPVCALFVMVNFKRFFLLNLLNLILYIIIFLGGIFFGYYTGYVIGYFVAGFYLLAREIFQYNIYSRYNDYLVKLGPQCRSGMQNFSLLKDNILEAFLAVCTFGTGLCFRFNLSIANFMMVLLVILSAIEISILLIQVKCKLSVYIEMIKMVVKTFLNTSFVLLLYVLTFGFCFHMIFSGELMSMISTRNDSEQNNNKLGSFESLWVTFIKTTVMMSGEYDASDLDLRSWTDYILLLCFVLTAIIIYNFINALAITDVEKLREKAEFEDIKLKITNSQRLQKLLDPCFQFESAYFLKKIATYIVSEPYNVKGMVIKDKIGEFVSEDELPKLKIPEAFYLKLREIIRNKKIEIPIPTSEETTTLVRKTSTHSATSNFNLDDVSRKLEALDQHVTSNFNCLSAQVTTKTDIFNLEFQILKSEMGVVRQEINSVKNNIEIMRISLQNFIERQSKK